MKIHHTTSYLVYTGFKNLAQIVVISSMIHFGCTEIWINLLITHQELWTFQPQINAENSVSAINRSIVNTNNFVQQIYLSTLWLAIKRQAEAGTWTSPFYWELLAHSNTTNAIQIPHIRFKLSCQCVYNYFMVHLTIYRYKLIENLSRLSLENRIPTLTIVIWQNEIKATLARAKNSLSC